MIDIIAALRVKNEGRWLREVLESIKWCSEIYLMDDHSTDDTREIASEYGANVLTSPFNTFDESRDKEWLVGNISKHYGIGNWVLMIDGDEVLEPGGEKKIRDTIANRAGATAFAPQIKYLWNSREQYRVDGVYRLFYRPSLFMMLSNYTFRRSGANGNLHPGCVPAVNRLGFRRCAASLLHLGYMDREDRIRKWKYYNAMDPINVNEGYDPAHPERGSYSHIVQGDIPEVPASAVLKHGGPLQLRAL